jgi:uncharacterized protein (TIGR02646 family)
MRHIQKSQGEPAELLAYRKSAGKDAHWDGFPDKAALRLRLLADQGALCCYCMRRIDDATMKIEHYRCQSRYPDDALKWQNLLAACKGGEGGPVRTCDTAKKDSDLQIDPQNRYHVSVLKYLGTGRIEAASTHSKFDEDINCILNLNAVSLQQQRKAALDGLLKELCKRLGKKKHWTKQKLDNELTKLSSDEKPRAFAGMLEYHLKKMIERRTR